jgi:phosphoribosylanthranilate isomerase
MTVIKICGVTTYEDALFAAQYGADLLGFNFYKKSPRYITPDDAMTICNSLRAEMGQDCPGLVGVFVNEVVGTISAITRKVGLNFAQLSGDESDVMLKELRGIGFKAIRPANVAQALDDVNYYAPYLPTNERIPSVLLDAYNPALYGGTGEQTGDDIALAVKEEVARLMLAGGLTPDNIADRIRTVQPWGVDVASGVEAEPGRKDHGKIRAFIQSVESV